jgi:hypothetical protein
MKKLYFLVFSLMLLTGYTARANVLTLLPLELLRSCQ